MKAVIILPIVSVATVYTSKRWHTGAHTSSLCLLLQPRSAESKAGEPGPCLGARRWLTLCSEGVRGATCSGEEHWGHATLKWPPLWHQGPGEDHLPHGIAISPAMHGGAPCFAAWQQRQLQARSRFFRPQHGSSKSSSAHRCLTRSSHVCKGCNCCIPPSFCAGCRGEQADGNRA